MVVQSKAIETERYVLVFMKAHSPCHKETSETLGTAV